MASHTLKAVQKIPSSLDEVWNFFTSPAKLHSITPADMKFRIISRHRADTIYAGQILEYNVSPLMGVPLYWMTEITQVSPKHFFADEQRKGPYKTWHHQHHFREIPGGVEMTDIIHYKNPFWLLGNMANTWFVRKKLEGLFAYRFMKIQELFGKWEGEDGGLALIEIA